MPSLLALLLALTTQHARSPSPGTAPAGRVEERSIESRSYGRGRRVWVYTPPGYEREPAGSSPPHELLVVFDGAEYLEDFPLPAILDRLIAEKKTPAFVAVLVDDGSGAERLDDLANRSKFAEFLAGELVPWIRKGWRVTSDPRHTVVAGSSAGGLAAAYVAFRRPDVFGNVLSQSGAFWRGNEASNDPPYEWLTTAYASAPKKDVRFVMEVGDQENRGALGGAAPSILEANRRLRDVLKKKGYEVEYFEVPNGRHGVESWRERFPAALTALRPLRTNAS